MMNRIQFAGAGARMRTGPDRKVELRETEAGLLSRDQKCCGGARLCQLCAAVGSPKAAIAATAIHVTSGGGGGSVLAAGSTYAPAKAASWHNRQLARVSYLFVVAADPARSAAATEFAPGGP